MGILLFFLNSEFNVGTPGEELLFLEAPVRADNPADVSTASCLVVCCPSGSPGCELILSYAQCALPSNLFPFTFLPDQAVVVCNVLDGNFYQNQYNVIVGPQGSCQLPS
jgi:hypothetical protein